MPQNDLLFPWKTILENVCLYGRIHGGQEQVKKEALSQMGAFGLEGYENEYPSALSGGMRQRAAFLRTLLCRADILLLDEPFGALDVITRGEMQDWLLGVRARLNRTVLLVTHDMDEAIYLSDRILILDPGSGRIGSEIEVAEKNRSRDWLYSQGELRRRIYRRVLWETERENGRKQHSRTICDRGRQVWGSREWPYRCPRSYRDRRGDPGTHPGWNPFCDMCGKPQRGGAIKTAVQSF